MKILLSIGAFTLLSLNSFSQTKEELSNYLGTTFENVLKSKGTPIDIVVNESSNQSNSPTIILIYNYNESYFFNNGVVTGGGVMFVNEQAKLDAKKTFDEKYH